VFKQMVKLYGDGLTSGDPGMYRNAIHRNVSECIYELCVQTDKLASHEEVKQSTKVLPANEDALKRVMELGRSNNKIDNETALMIDRLWKDPGIQVCYSHRNLFQLYDSAAYLLDRALAVLESDYPINDEDILRTRIRTTGMIQKTFQMGDNFQMRLVDVGGQRSERKKWIKWFEGVTAVMFVTAISEYNQVCFEDEFTNRMEESFSVFSDTVNSDWFKDSSVILFLNKVDQFVQKLSAFPLKDKFPEYEPSNEPQSAFDFIEDRFMSLVNDPDNHTVFVHFTTATDSDNMIKVLEAVKHTLLKNALQHANIM